MDKQENKSAQFAGVAYTCVDNYPSGWPYCKPLARKLTRREWKERKSYAKDAQSWHEGRVFALGQSQARSVAARLFHGELKRGFPVRNLAAASRNFTPNFLQSYRARIERMRVLKIDALSYNRAAWHNRVPFAPNPIIFFPAGFKYAQ